MPSLRYDLAVQHHAAKQVLLEHHSVAQVARQLNCSPQSVKNWIERHRDTIIMTTKPPSHTTFLPIQVDPLDSMPPPHPIELVTKNGLTLHFPVDMPCNILCDIIRRLEGVPC